MQTRIALGRRAFARLFQAARPLVVGFVLLTLSACAATHHAAWRTVPDFSALARTYGPAVVNVGVARGSSLSLPAVQQVARPGGRPGDRVDENSLGSGFIISEDGLILTNAHVVDRGTEISIKLTDRREFKARLIGLDRASDIALLKINATGLPTVAIGDPGSVQAGDWAVAIGSPFGFTNSVTGGIISGTGRVLPGADSMPFLQTDVPINPGNSGGPLFNLEGKVIGVNSRIYSNSGGYQGLSFAIPIDVAMRIKTQLLAQGKVTRGRIGFAVQEVSQPLAASFRLPRPVGALVSFVEPGGPADRAGLRPGDVVLQVGERQVVESAHALIHIAESLPGTPVGLTVWRDGAAVMVAVVPDPLDAPQVPLVRQVEPSAPLGLVVRPLAPAERQALRVEAGLMVQRVNAAALRAGVKPGDVILSLNGQPVGTMYELAAEVGAADGVVALLIQRGATRVFIPIDIPRPGTAGE